MKLHVFMKTLAVSAMVLVTGIAQAATYYVDPSSTASTANGSLSAPWKSLSAISWSSITAGDQILFKRGQKFQGTLTIGKSGTASAPIVLGAYGTGPNPHFWGTGASIQALFTMYSRSYITFQDLTISDTTISATDRTVQSRIQRGFVVDNSTNILIKRCVLDRVGVGAYFTGDNNTMDSCDIGNMRMVKNTNDGPPPGNDDDYGANPVVISSSGNKITNNNFHDCWAMSFDYGVDGGAIDIYADRSLIENNFIAYNTFTDCNGALEIGGSGGNTVNNTTLAYNKMVNNGSILYVSNSGTFLTYTNNIQFYNNVIVESEAYRLVEPALFSFKSAPTAASSLVLKNNIIQLYGTIDVCRSQWGTAGALVHEDNIFKLGSGSVLNFTIAASELITTSNSIFANTSATNPLSWDFKPHASSPAIDFGQVIAGLTRDFLGNPVPSSGVRDAGIIEAIVTGATLQVSSSATAIACNGGTSTVTVSASGGTTPYTGTGTFSVNAGTYTYTVTDASGTSASTSVTVSQPTAISATVNTGTIAINGGTTTATVTASGGTGTLTYKLNNGSYQSSNTFSGVAAGNHTVTVKDANGCTKSVSFTISQPTALSASSSASAISCNGGSSTVTVTATGGVSPYSGTGSFSVTAGTYSYTVTDANGATASTSVTIGQPTVISASVSTGTIAVNGGTTTATVTASGGTGTLTYRLNNGSYQASNVFTGVAAGSHSVTVKDANGCTKSVSFTLTQPTSLTAGSSATAISCNGGSSTVTVTATGGVAPYSGTGTFSVTAGTYSYTVTDANGATASTSVTISEPSAITASVNAGTITVNGGTTSVTVTAAGGTGTLTYKLNNGSYQSSNTFSGVSAGNHTVTVKDANGCTKSVSFTISQPSVLSATSSAAAISCNGGSTTVTVSASGGTAPYSGTGSFSVSAGTYSYTVTDAAGSSVSTSITVTQPTAIAVTVSAGTITVFGGTTSVVVGASGGTGTSYTYKLNNGSYQSSNTFANVAAGNHAVTVKDANGCTSVKNFTITQPANNPLVATAGATAIMCFGGTATVTVSATGGTAPYVGVGTFTVTAGTYNYTVQDANGNTASASVTVSQPAAALAISIATGTITINGGSTTATVTATGGTSPYTYSLDGGSYQSSNVISGVVAGNHTITVKDANGCTRSGNFSLTQPDGITVNAVQGSPILCNGGSTTVTITATGGTAPYTGTGTFTVSAGTYSYTVTDAAGASASRSITVSQPSVISVSVSADPISNGETTTTAIITASGGTGTYSYSIDGGPFQSGNTFAGITAGDHVATVLDQNGCTSSENFAVSLGFGQTLSVNLVNKANVSCRGGRDGSIEVLAFGGSAPYTYSINEGRYTTATLFKNLTAGNYRVTVKDANSNTVSLVVYVFDGRRRCADLGLSGKVVLSAYPNPSIDRFTLTVDSEDDTDVVVDVYNAEGKPMHTEKGKFDKKFTFGENFKSGMYIIKVRQGAKVETLRVIKGK